MWAVGRLSLLLKGRTDVSNEPRAQSRPGVERAATLADLSAIEAEPIPVSEPAAVAPVALAPVAALAPAEGPVLVPEPAMATPTTPIAASAAQSIVAPAEERGIEQ